MDTEIDDLARELVLVIRRIAIATENMNTARRELEAATAHKVRLEERVTKLTGGQLYGAQDAGRLPPDPPGDRTTLLGLDRTRIFGG